MAGQRGAAQAADWPRLAEARGSLEHDLARRGASGEPAGRGLSHRVLHIGPAYLKLNPTGTVPTLEDDGVVVLESAAMLSYLANKHQWTDLYPQEAAARARTPPGARTPN